MDIAKIEEIIEVLEASRTEELSVRRGEISVHVKKRRIVAQVPASTAAAPAVQSQAPQSVQEEASNDRVILAPMVGIFHAVDGLAREGAHVSAGQVVGAIESMKLLNDVISEFTGVVREAMVEDGTPVEYGQPLCRIELD